MQQQHVLGVHGIGQGKTSQHELTKNWSDAIERGVQQLHGPTALLADSVHMPVLRVPHWSALLADETGRLNTRDVMPDDAAPFTADEEAFVIQALDDLLTVEERAYAAVSVNL